MEVVNVEEPICAVRISQYPDDKKNEFLILGRSNVGKSSFINTIINRKNMAKTSSKPGKTQTINFYHINSQFYIVDVPGYGYAQTSKATQKKFGLMIEEYLKTRNNLQNVFMIIDARNKPTENDVLMYNYLKYYNIPVTIIANKYDKIKANSRDKTLKTIASILNVDEQDKIVYFSSVSKKGREEVYSIIEEYLNK